MKKIITTTYCVHGTLSPMGLGLFENKEKATPK